MKTEQAANALAILNAAFPREALEPATVRLYIDEIALLWDPAAGIEAARLIARQGERFPTLREFRATYHRIAEANRSSVPALPEARSSEVPEWVQVWWWARHVKGDDRMLPQQDDCGGAPTMSFTDYTALLNEWKTSGAARIGAKRLLGVPVDDCPDFEVAA